MTSQALWVGIGACIATALTLMFVRSSLNSAAKSRSNITDRLKRLEGEYKNLTGKDPLIIEVPTQVAPGPLGATTAPPTTAPRFTPTTRRTPAPTTVTPTATAPPTTPPSTSPPPPGPAPPSTTPPTTCPGTLLVGTCVTTPHR